MCGLCVLAVFTVFLFNLWAPNNYVKPVPAHIVEAHFTRSLIKLHVFFFFFFFGFFGDVAPIFKIFIILVLMPG